MKKIFQVLIISTISVFVIFSCRKSFEPEINPDQVTKPANETELKIRTFLNQMSNQLKDGKTYSIDSAIWYAETTLNFTYAIYDSTFVYLSRDSSAYSIDLNENNTVNGNDLFAAYEKMVDSLEAHYNCIQGSIKHVFLCDIINVSNSVATLDLLMVSVIGYGNPINQYGSFGPTDYWYSGCLMGKCNYYTGDGDATTELEYKLLHPYIAPCQNVRVYYENIDKISYIYSHDYPYSPSPRGFCGYYFYSENPYAGVQCLPPDELNFYISNNGIPYIIEANDTYSDKEFCLIDVVWDISPGVTYYIETHYFNISYGERKYTSVPVPIF